ncbi:AAA family ATPase [Sinorhizobium sp. 6-70]|nr:trifunctional serine/threonine-protein kinase/ATP-binding protein/sensor histidine kinase [Sinorhizobium sp. 6-70]MDK1374437.1 AAA family ATPase [Sinorhizobium sp. 6-70]
MARLVGAPMELGQFLPLAIALSGAVAQMHASGLIHKDIKPGNVLVSPSTNAVRLTGFGIASRVPRERLSPAPPEVIAGTFAYMAPEQTGRMNRSIDARSDLYALGVTLYEVLTGVLPFAATEPMEWIHCHIARQPLPPGERVPAIPGAVSEIIMKLLSKGAEDRYQTAAGLCADLQHCLEQWAAGGGIAPFVLGARDASGQLLFQEKLYGREAEIARLVTAFDRVLADGASGLVLVSGYSGIGKSSVVNELQRALVPPRGLFAAGKFDQYKLGIPYATLAQAFQGLVRQLLSKSDAELARWRVAFIEALGLNGQLMVNLIPELALVIGEQPPVPDLSAAEAQSRFLLVFRQLLGVFARPEHPLVLFLDDLQWLDSATLDAFEHLATQPEVRHLLLVGAYRDNEVGSTHPLTQRLRTIRDSRGGVEEMVLGPILLEDVTSMVAEALGADPKTAIPLAQVVFEKAGGNPFFTVQFVSALVDDGLLVFDQQVAAWRWDDDRVGAKSVGDNVVDLMIERLSRLPDASLGALKHLACLGNSVEIDRFRQVTGASQQETQSLLHEALRVGLLHQVDAAYAFAHDRVHEAAYALLREPERAGAHRRIGMHLLAALSESEVDAEIFDIASHFNRSDIAGADAAERATASALNLRAGWKAKASAAYAAACDFLAHGRALLGEDGWSSHYALAFALTLDHAECTFLNGDFDGAERMAASALDDARTRVDKAAIHRLRIELHVVRSDYDAAVGSALAALRLFDIDFPPHPSREETEREFGDVWKNLGGRPFESIADLPPMTDPEMLAAMRILAELWAPAYFTDFNLAILAGCRMVNLSLVHGAANISNQGYALLGFFMGPAFGRYHDGYRLANLAGELAERRNVLLDMARVGDTMALAASWTEPLTTAIDCWRKAYRRGVEAGDLYFACYSAGHIGLHLLVRGHSLQQDAAECKAYLDSARRTGFRDGMDMIVASERAIACLRGLTRGLAEFSDDEFDETEFAAALTDSRMVVGWYYWTRKIMLHFLAGDHRAALAAADKLQPSLWLKIVQGQRKSEPRSSWKSSAGFHLDYHYYSALALAARMEEVSVGQRGALRKLLDAHHRQLSTWAEETRSPTFADKHVLVEAEIARLDGRELKAQRLYEDSIRLAYENGFLQHAAIACELAAQFYARRGFDRIARQYLREARYCYLRWGADGKVRQLDELHPSAREERLPVGPTGTTEATLEHLDVATVIRVSQAVSGEIVLDKLIDTLMRTAIEHAGAGRAVLILSRGDEHRVEAEAVTGADAVTVDLRKTDLSEAGLPVSIVHYAMRTRENVILGDASAQTPFSADPYIGGKRPRSLLCLPLTTQAKLIGVLYLENNLSAHVFTADRIAVLKLLASQAAISLENTRLYGELEEREARIRRLVESNVIGIVIWDLNGRLLDANDAFLRMVQYERADLDAGLSWFDMTPPEWQEVHALQEAEELKATGTMKAREKEYFRKDGSRIPVLIGAAAFDRRPDQGVAYIIDLTERKQAEARIRESERRYRELQSELAHANRVATMGQLSAWIVHDVSQPLTSVVASGNAGLRWLVADPPNLERVRGAFERVIRDGRLATEILDRIRALVKKTSPRREAVDINDVVSETLALTSAEVRRNGIVVKTDLAETLPAVSADRVQIQQVVLNLIVNAVEAMTADTAQPLDLTVVSSTDASGRAVIAVGDSGPGLTEEHRERVFDAFHSTKPNGLGMGLAICRTIIESHGGSIWVTPNEPRGAVFHFALPESDAG